MKNLLAFITASITCFQLNAQCNAASWRGMPDELVHDRLFIPGAVYGNPYTMFD